MTDEDPKYKNFQTFLDFWYGLSQSVYWIDIIKVWKNQIVVMKYVKY